MIGGQCGKCTSQQAIYIDKHIDRPFDVHTEGYCCDAQTAAAC